MHASKEPQASDVAHEFEGSLKRETENTTAEGEKILSFVARLLKENDRVLTHLETLASEVKSTGSDFSAMRHASQLSGILADYVAGELYYRLDRLYLWEMQTPKPNSEELWAVADEAMAALAEDLESLYLEIDVLAQMSASEQFNKPILRELQNHRNHEHAVSHKTLGLV